MYEPQFIDVNQLNRTEMSLQSSVQTEMINDWPGVFRKSVWKQSLFLHACKVMLEMVQKLVH